MNKDKKIIVLSCSIFKNSLDFLRNSGKFDGIEDFVYINSMMHIYPDKLQKIIDDNIESLSNENVSIGLIYGDCHPYMNEYIKKGIERSSGINCIEIFLGKTLYHQLRNEGAFFLLPEWVKRWKEIFVEHLGLDDTNAKTFMKEMHKKLVYIDTGIEEINYEILSDISKYTGLSYEIIKISLDHLENEIKRIIGVLKDYE